MLGTYTSYGLFGLVSGTVSNINFINATLNTLDAEEHVSKIRSNLGFVAGHLNNGTISNVHALGNISLPNNLELGKMYVGGLVGYGQGTISQSSAAGTINGGIHPYDPDDEKSNQSAIGGLMGYSLRTTMTESISAMDITGLSYAASNTTTLYLGGLIGYGITNHFFESINRGDILSNHQNGYIYKIYQGGAIGLHTQELLTTARVNNEGAITIVTKAELIAKVAGYGNVIGTNNFIFTVWLIPVSLVMFLLTERIIYQRRF